MPTEKSGSWKIIEAAGGITGTFGSTPPSVELRIENVGQELWLDIPNPTTILLLR